MGKLNRSIKSLVRDYDLYKNKPLLERLMLTIYTADLFTPLFNTYYAARHFILNIKKLVEFAPVVWKHEDWDYGYIDRMNLYLFKRLYKGIIDKGVAQHSRKTKRHLKAIIACLEALDEEHEVGKGLEQAFEAKWGKNDYYCRPVPGKNYSMFGNRNRDNLTPEQEKQYYKEQKDLHLKQQALLKSYRAYMNLLLTKHSDKFWD